MTQHLEQSTKRAICEWLTFKKIPFVVVQNTGTVVYVNGQYRFGRRASYLSPRGVPDLICCLDGKFVAIEVKSPTGKLSSYQRDWLEWAKSCGAIICVARSVNDVEKIIK